MFNFFIELKKHFKLDNQISSYQMINMSNRFIYLEGHKGILNFTDNMINIKVKSGVLVIKGKDLFLSEISCDTISIKGEINCIEKF